MPRTEIKKYTVKQSDFHDGSFNVIEHLTVDGRGIQDIVAVAMFEKEAVKIAKELNERLLRMQKVRQSIVDFQEELEELKEEGGTELKIEEVEWKTLNAKDTLLHDGYKQIPQYLNAYVTTQAYGGPEEGGWFYSISEPVLSIPTFVIAPVELSREARWKLVNRKKENILKEKSEFDIHYETLMYDSAGSFSIPGKGKLCVFCEDVFAVPKPTRKPHYE